MGVSFRPISRLFQVNKLSVVAEEPLTASRLPNFVMNTLTADFEETRSNFAMKICCNYAHKWITISHQLYNPLLDAR